MAKITKRVKNKKSRLTKELWFTYPRDDGSVFIGAMPHVLTVDGDGDYELGGPFRDKIRRLVACFNAFNGIEDPAAFMVEAKKKEKTVVILCDGGLVEEVKGAKDHVIVNFDVPEDKSMWKEAGVCLGCKFHKNPATH